jgi:hypothetical protein
MSTDCKNFMCSMSGYGSSEEALAAGEHIRLTDIDWSHLTVRQPRIRAVAVAVGVGRAIVGGLNASCACGDELLFIGVRCRRCKGE